MTLHIGFTGTRFGMSTAQHGAVRTLIAMLERATQIVGHHGDCVGADSEFHALVREYPGALIVIHPGPHGEHSAGCMGDERLDSMSHMKRNRAIVNASAVMIGAPFENEPRLLGGTWATIAMARKALLMHLRRLYVVGREGQLLDHAAWKRGRP